MTHPLEEIVTRGQCMGCGLCAATLRDASPATRVTMVPDPELGHYRPVVSGWKTGDEPGSYVCPGASMDMPALSLQVHGREPEDPITGIWREVRAVASTDPVDRQRAASGGAVPAILRHLFDSDEIDCAYCLITSPDERDGYGALITHRDELRKAHGSMYHPADFGRNLARLLAGEERFAIVGLPCQIAGLQMIFAEDPAARSRCVLTIAVFCGGINRFDGIAYYLEAFDIQADAIRTIRYREGEWPGAMAVELADGETRKVPRIHGNSRWKILRYMAAFQGPWMLKRCRICPDQIGDFADISVGDPHLPRFRALAREESGQGYSAMLIRSEHGERIVAAALSANRLRELPLSRDELVASQGYTLENRRQAAIYAAMERHLRGSPPSIVPYAKLEEHARFRHRVSAFLDLVKLRVRLNRFTRVMLPYWQAFEYLFLRFPLLFLGNRLLKLLKNR
ncbi:MAG: Coenzyme F420 hydrogenase/dehydrogenase, beta subunit C-terminal domain [Pseudomonadales bacterium]|nr:Coenzyme F420 hydrogenase/dehydrogenase, beta subunit C-terminal domain [Pseudomonadales bacterium]